jgi:GrpB-like predicted nucleotidyltransferase (UPF0157 family)
MGAALMRAMAKPIKEYDPRWPELFASEAERLREGLHGLIIRVDHVGSTAVPGLAAKPTIDIQIVAPHQAAIEACALRLQSLGYCHATMPIAFFHRPSSWPHTHHVHVREFGSFEERRLRLFRDWLCAHEGDRQAYERLKLELASSVDMDHQPERARYSEAKTGFVREIERRAAWER